MRIEILGAPFNGLGTFPEIENPAVRVIHLYEQTKWRAQLPAMLDG